MNEPMIQITGNLTADVDLRYTPSGKPVAHLNVACNPRRQDASGTWVDGTPTFWPCQIWGPAAEHATESLAKGDRVMVTGRIKAHVWTPTDGDHAGVEQRRLDVVVDEIGISLRYHPAKTTKATRTTTASSPELVGEPAF